MHRERERIEGLDPILTDSAITVTVANGDAALYDKVMAASKDAKRSRSAV